MRYKTPRIITFVSVLSLAQAPAAVAGSISLQWEQVSGADGYRVYYGQASRQYTRSIDVPGATEVTIDGLTDCKDWYLAVKAYSEFGESAGFSQEVSGWPRPEVRTLYTPTVEQGTMLMLDFYGSNFQPGAELTLEADPLPTDINGEPLVRINSHNVVSCNEIAALITVEPTARGFRAMKLGDLELSVSVRNPDTVYGSEPATLRIGFNESRWDINRSDASTRDSVDGADLSWLAYAYATSEGQDRFNPDADLDGNGVVDGDDLALLAAGFGRCRSGSVWSESACP